MTSCRSDEAGTWTCEIIRKNGYRGWILWNPNRTIAFHPSSAWQVQQTRDLSAGVQKLSKDQTIQITQTPILLENAML